jgi:hypothetical protein
LLQRRLPPPASQRPPKAALTTSYLHPEIGPAGRQGLGVIPTELIEQMFEAVP